MALVGVLEYNLALKLQERKMAKYIRDIIITILVALLIFILLQTTIGSFKVYGTSMMPGIKDGEYIMVTKISYYFGPPQRGDVIVFSSPKNPGSDLIKRIIAIPGDTVEIKDNRVFVHIPNHFRCKDICR